MADADRSLLGPPGGDPDSSDDLLEACLRGDGGAWRRLYLRESPRLGRLLRRMALPPHEVDDVIQETFVTVLRRLGDFDGRTHLRSWIWGIALRKALGLRRHLGRALARTARMPPTAPPPTPEDEAARGEARQDLVALLGAMQRERRAAFVLYELEGVGTADIARMLGCAETTVYTRLHRAREEFRRELYRRRGEPAP